VVNPSTEEIRDAFFMREYLEDLAWDLSGPLFDTDDIKDLRRMVAEETCAVHQGNFDRYLEINRAFHLYPAQKSGNVYLIRFMEKLLTQIGIYLTLFDAFYDRSPSEIRSLTEHARIIERVEKKQWNELKEEVRRHTRASHDNLQLQQSEYRTLEDALGYI
jgi:DNA-binding GntR family transcriptional regulator